jgi:hypothetical protein
MSDFREKNEEAGGGPSDGSTPAVAADEPWVSVTRLTAVATAAMVEDILRQNGIAVRCIGTRNASSIGFGQVTVDQRLEVPQSQHARATELVEVFFSQVGGDEAEDIPAELTSNRPIEDPHPLAPQELSSALFKPKSRLRAAGLAIYPGFAHWYVGLPWTGLLLIASYLVVVIEVVGIGVFSYVEGLVVYGGSFLVDLIGGQIFAIQTNKGKSFSSLVQLAIGVGYFIVFVLAATLLQHG